jgi:ribosomal protein S10
MSKKTHPLAGRKQSKETIAKRLATIAERRAARAKGESLHAASLPKQQKRPYTKRRLPAFDPRTHEQLQRDVHEALWCIDKAVAKTRLKIRSGELSLTDVTDEETFLYMAKRYLEGGLKP